MNTTKQVTIDPTIFRAYDIRGIVDENLTEEQVYLIALAIGTQVSKKQEKQIIVARDGRLSSPSLSQALINGLLDTGLDVIDIGAVPSPLLYFATHTLTSHSGVMVTGSHNPSNYNGLKIVIDGRTLVQNDIQQLYQATITQEFQRGQGQQSSQPVINDYINRIYSDIQLAKPMKIVIDCGNGIAGTVAPTLFKTLGCEVSELYCDVDGRFPNHHPDPSIPENLQDLIKTVQQEKADIGLAFDGDADRLAVVTDRGEIIWPDRQMILYATDILARHPGATIVYDVKCTANLEKMIRKHGGHPVMCQTGHSIVKARVQEEGALLGGELSGHIFFQERWYGFDDGLYSACRLLEILSKQSQSVHDIFDSIPDSINTPEIKISLPEERKFTVMQQLQEQANFPDAQIIDIDGLRVEYEDGWGLVRASNTTPCLIVRFEADNEKALQRIQTTFKEQLLAIDSSLKITF